MIQRSLSVFESMIKTEATRKTYTYHLKGFLSYYKIKDYDGLLTIPNEKLQIMLEDYLMFMKKQVSPNSIPTIFAGIELFFKANDKLLNFWKMHKMFPGKVKRSGFQPYTTEQIRDMLNYSKSRRNRALIHFLTSAGCRVGALSGLTMNDVEDMPNGCKAVFLYKDTNEEYWAFLTPEASQALDSYLDERRNDKERIEKTNPVFRSDYKMGIEKVKPLGYNALFSIIYRLITGAKIQREKKGQRFNIMMDHGFRKRFNTILKINNEVNSNIAEKLMSHKNGLDGAYLKPTKEECFKEFVKAIPELTIDPTERQRVELKQKETKITELEAKEREIDDIKSQLKAKERTSQGDHIRLVRMEEEIERLRNVVREEGYNEEEPDPREFMMESEFSSPNRITIDASDDSKLLVNIKKALIGLEKRIEERNKKFG